MNMTEKDVIDKINKLKRKVNDPEAEFSPLDAQAILDEITELEYMLADIRREKLKVTPVINAPTVAERPKGRRNHRMGTSRLFI